MRIVCFRHGPAEDRNPERGPDDGARRLTSHGEARTRRAAKGLLRLEGTPHVVLSSPLVRCAETAAILAEVTRVDRTPEALDALAPRGSWRDVLRRLAEEGPAARVVLVGHEPDLGKLAGVLLFGAPKPLAIKKAGACCIEFDEDVAPGAGRLRWFLPPRALACIATSRSKV